MRGPRSNPTFSAMDVCRALDIPHGTLNSWAFHGMFKGFDAEKTTPGKARKYTLDDLFRLGILKRLLDLGIPGENANRWAILCVRYIEQAMISEMHILNYRDRQEIRPNAELMTDPEQPGVLLRLTIYPREIVKSMKERLGVE